MRRINVFANKTPLSVETERLLKCKLENSGFVVPKEFDSEAELIICIGGDGAFLKTLHEYDFPDIPFIGINTGHLGFFQELNPDGLDEFIFRYKKGKYGIQPLKTVRAIVSVGNEKFEHKGLNEIVIKGNHSHSIHLNMSIGDSFIERFSGDGILVATPAGSTAYNYALGGSIVDPRLELLQITPIAPMNTTAYRSFTSSVLLPPNLSVKINPEEFINTGVLISQDGMEKRYGQVSEIFIEFSDSVVKLLRFENYDFWNKVKSKFL
ncbi:NAD(+)/NADH kinase [Anaerovorax odorimutans]|uniref:NAD(+)/NADH kinase n=1 Tax=Anaerovorax odorimutans TaxID=109327 RepID=UPI00041F4E1E|nr:NAD(+)/NADH kinase [Anaerovorax odorimutans]